MPAAACPRHSIRFRGRLKAPVTIAARPRHSIRQRRRVTAPAASEAAPRPLVQFRRRSLSAVVLAPEPPLTNWLVELDACIQRSPKLFVGRPVILDLSTLPLAKPELAALIADLHARSIRILAVDGADPGLPGLGMPPVVNKGRQAGAVKALDKPALRAASEPAFLLLDSSVRSGQSISFPEGDVTVVGSVASGAEVAAGGSIHIYGALRGRAIAGTTGNPRARIFCQRFEAELLGIAGRHKAADEIDPQLHGRRVQAWLERGAIRMTALEAHEDSAEAKLARRVTAWPRFWS